MEDEREERSAQLVSPAHYELYTRTKSDGVIRIICDCLLGRDHTYDEWVAELGEGKYKGTEDPVDVTALKKLLSKGRGASRGGRGDRRGLGLSASRQLGDRSKMTRLDLYVERMIALHDADREAS